MTAEKIPVTDLVAETTVPTSSLTPQPTGGTTAPRASGSTATQKRQQDGVTIELAPASAAEDDTFVKILTGVVNAAYLVTEGSIFVEGYARTNVDELRGIIRDGELAVAYLTSPGFVSDASGEPAQRQRERKVVGCIRIQHLSPSLGEFAMLALDSSYRGGGMGRELVRFAEEHCRGLGMSTMQLELLVPKGFEHAFKKRLHGWYSRMGYEIVRMGSFQEEYPHLAPLLRGSCEYRIYEKRLV